MNAIGDLEAPRVWNASQVIELLPALRGNGQQLGPTSEWYFACKKIRTAGEQEKTEDTDCSTCRIYSMTGLRYVQWEGDDVLGCTGISIQLEKFYSW
jgi:hypothetical protein